MGSPDLNFRVYASPIVSSMYPDRYLVGRKTSVLVKGQHFRSINDGVEAKCNFGENVQSKANVVSESEIVCDAPVIQEASAHETQRIRIFSEQKHVEQQII